MTSSEGENVRNKVTVNCSSNARQTNAHIFRLLRRTDTKQRYWNSSCCGDHDATKEFGIITLLHCETSVLNFGLLEIALSLNFLMQ